MKRTAISVLCASLLTVVGLGVATAQSFPTRTVTLVVPAAPGGPTDALARVLADQLGATLGQSVVVENRGGANGTIGVASVARAKPDGHEVLLSVDGPITTIPALMAKVPYDATRDLQPVAIVGDGGDVVLAVPAGSPAGSPDDLAAMLRKDPAGSNYVSSGAGFPSHIVAELFKREGKFDAQHIPMRGAGAAMTELLSGRMSFSLPPASLAAVHARAGKIRILASASATRNQLLPDTPTFTEAGYAAVTPPGYWIAAYLPAGVPQTVLDTLVEHIQRAVRTEPYVKLLQRQGMRASPSTPEEIRKRVVSETDYWGRTIRTLGIKVE